MKATIYIPDDKYAVYEEARETLGDSISATFLHCLERALEAKKQAVGRIVVEVQAKDNPDLTVKKSFEGRWIVGDGEDGDQFLFDEHEEVHGGGNYSVAITKASRLVVLESGSPDDYPTFEVFENYRNFANAQNGHYPQFPESLKQAVAAELDIDRVEEMDI